MKPSAVVVGINTVRAVRGITAEAVMKLVDRGDLRFVFDLASPGCGKLRALRFWIPEIVDAGAVAKLKLSTVITMILPRGPRLLSGAEIGQRFLLSRTAVHRMRSEVGGAVNGRVLFVERAALAAWLRQRWIGGRK
jgi:hypothetical protein